MEVWEDWKVSQDNSQIPFLGDLWKFRSWQDLVQGNAFNNLLDQGWHLHNRGKATFMAPLVGTFSCASLLSESPRPCFGEIEVTTDQVQSLNTWVGDGQLLSASPYPCLSCSKPDHQSCKLHFHLKICFLLSLSHLEFFLSASFSLSRTINAVAGWTLTYLNNNGSSKILNQQFFVIAKYRGQDVGTFATHTHFSPEGPCRLLNANQWKPKERALTC